MNRSPAAAINCNCSFFRTLALLLVGLSKGLLLARQLASCSLCPSLLRGLVVDDYIHARAVRTGLSWRTARSESSLDPGQMMSVVLFLPNSGRCPTIAGPFSIKAPEFPMVEIPCQGISRLGTASCTGSNYSYPWKTNWLSMVSTDEWAGLFKIFP